MTLTNPILLSTPSPATTPTSPSSTSSTSAADNVLGPDAFITLLTAQLQAQDPLNPMDPNQMVDELTSMNTLQETIQMRQDLDALVAAIQGTGTSSAPPSSGIGSNAAASGTLGNASNAITPNLSAISGSPAAVSAAKLYSTAKLQSQIF
jgi:flagellar basal-body rod modification protein FlgD